MDRQAGGGLMWTYHATVTRVVDGDSIEATVDVGFYHYCTQRFRLMGYNAPELTGEERQMGAIAAAALSEMILLKDVTLRTHKGDSFGRWLADVTLENNDDLVANLIGAGYGVAWDGRGARPRFDPQAIYPLVR